MSFELQQADSFIAAGKGPSKHRALRRQLESLPFATPFILPVAEFASAAHAINYLRVFAMRHKRTVVTGHDAHGERVFMFVARDQETEAAS